MNTKPGQAQRNRSNAFNLVFRLIFAALIALLGIGFIGSSYEFLGLIALLASFSIAVRGAFEIIFHVVLGLIFVLAVLLVVWLPQGTFGKFGFFDWISEYWFIAVFYVGLVLYGIIRQFVNRDTTWQLLAKTHGVSSRTSEQLSKWPSASGYLEIYEDYIPVKMYQVPQGFLANRRGFGPLLFRWDRIAEVRAPMGKHNQGTIYLKKSVGPVIPVVIPWAHEFRVSQSTNKKPAGN